MIHENQAAPHTLDPMKRQMVLPKPAKHGIVVELRVDDYHSLFEGCECDVDLMNETAKRLRISYFMGNKIGQCRGCEVRSLGK